MVWLNVDRNSPASNDPVQQSFTCFEAPQIFEEKTHEFFVLIDGAARDVAGDKTIGRIPQGMLRRQRLGFHDIQIRAGHVTRFQSSD